MKPVLRRLREPSSYAGVAAVSLGVERLAAGDWQTGLASLFGGLAAILLPERQAGG